MENGGLQRGEFRKGLELAKGGGVTNGATPSSSPFSPTPYFIINRPGVARAVPQSPLLLIDLLID